ncbi:hypothetical protein R1flu_004954 [Riccia fluitans]|uniref:Uncharacterized protein n=1 Tax=Riccia fluitans TaxID=41844 RepID=A0ABD1YSL3_9MARC
METHAPSLIICKRPRAGFFTSFALAFVAVSLVSCLLHKSLAVAVEQEEEEETPVLEVYTEIFMKSGVILPRRADREDNMASTDQRSNWSHLVGMNAEEAKKKIQEDHPHLQVVVLRKGAMMTMDYNLHRVRILKDENEKVASVPKLG